MLNELMKLQANLSFPLDGIGTWRATHHQFDEQTVWALQAAYAAGRPLLIQGEPGCGKSQVARAVAQKLKCAFIPIVIHPRSEFTDLLWRFDAVARLGQAQLLSHDKFGLSQSKQSGPDHDGNDGNGQKCQNLDPRDALDPQRFLVPGPLWWAVNWKSARTQSGHAKLAAQNYQPHTDYVATDTSNEGASPAPPKRVLLIDEIDKAQVELPNGLLEVLDNGSFAIPYVADSVVASADPAPLVIITSNGECRLPKAFMRRCFVLTMKMKEDKNDFIDWLVERGKIHFQAEGEHYPDIFKTCAERLWAFRQAAIQSDESKPGQSEYLDLLKVLFSQKDDYEKRLDQVQEFAFNKNQPDDL